MNEQSSPSLPSVFIIGTGFGGLGMAIRLKQAGFCNLTLLEKAGGIGGTWRDNTYPGAACDVQSHLYSYSFEPKHDWSRKFGRQPEILEYLEHCVAKYHLADHIRFHAEVSDANFDEAKNAWLVSLTNGECLSADILITATGQLNQPARPDIEGLETFTGKYFHSARWDSNYDLTGKRVAVIGTGASAIQFVPEIVEQVQSLSLFQRSAAWVLPKPERRFRRWEQQLFKAVPAWDRIYRYWIYLKNESRALAFTRLKGLLQLFAWQAKRSARKQVTDPQKRAQLIPHYQIGCKRILISNDWYASINSPHVDLVTNQIRHIEPDGVVTQDGTHYPVDAIIFGTGFRASDFLSPISITGRSGIELQQAWKEGAAAFKGITVHGFPNMFILYGPNTNLAHNSIIYMLESQFRYVTSALKTLAKHPGAAMEIRKDRQDRFTQVVQQQLKGSVWASGCHSWYLDADGKNTVNWPGFTFSYRFATRRANTEDFHFLYPRTGL